MTERTGGLSRLWPEADHSLAAFCRVGLPKANRSSLSIPRHYGPILTTILGSRCGSRCTEESPPSHRGMFVCSAPAPCSRQSPMRCSRAPCRRRTRPASNCWTTVIIRPPPERQGARSTCCPGVALRHCRFRMISCSRTTPGRSGMRWGSGSMYGTPLRTKGIGWLLRWQAASPIDRSESPPRSTSPGSAMGSKPDPCATSPPAPRGSRLCFERLLPGYYGLELEDHLSVTRPVRFTRSVRISTAQPPNPKAPKPETRSQV